MTPSERDNKMWAFFATELASTKALLNTILALMRLQLLTTGLSEEEIDQSVKTIIAANEATEADYAHKLMKALLEYDLNAN